MIARLTVRYALLIGAAVALNFLLPRFLPGDPLSYDADEGSALLADLPAAARDQLRAYYGLDLSLPEQFSRYVTGLARFDLGWSISRGAPVAALVAERVPWTLGLVLVSIVSAALLGTALGVWAAWRGGRAGRSVLDVTSLISALPEFLVAMLLLLVFAVWLRWLPIQGGRTAFAGQSDDLAGLLARGGDVVWHLMLPALTLITAHSSAFVLLSHGAVSGVKGAPYIATARSKGLSERNVVVGHVLPNAILPMVTLFGLRLGLVFSGAVIVERMFAIPGLGQLAFQAVKARDYPVVQAVFLLASVAVLVANFGTELVYAYVNPLARQSGALSTGRR